MAIPVDLAQPLGQFAQRDRLMVDRHLPIGGVFEHDVGRRLIVAARGLCRQVRLETDLRKRQRRHEDHQQHEEHVDERGDVQVGAGARTLRTDDGVGTEMPVDGHRVLRFEFRFG